MINYLLRVRYFLQFGSVRFTGWLTMVLSDGALQPLNQTKNTKHRTAVIKSIHLSVWIVSKPFRNK